MRKYLLPQKGNFYKANLHCHTTVSDGVLTPEQVKKAYMEKGYSIVAYTDHDIMIDHSNLQEENFLPLRGWEIEFDEKNTSYRKQKTCHICLIAISSDNKTQICYNRTGKMIGNASKYRNQAVFDDTLPDYEIEYSVDCVNDVIRTGLENGFFVTYNHPSWSLEEPSTYLAYNGMNAMEIANWGCIEDGYEDHVPHIYDDMLRAGKRIYCSATDDNHNYGDNWWHDSFGGFNMIKAEKLEYNTITAALVNGDFYSSMGPEIYELYIEDGKIHIKCSPVQNITVHTGSRRSRSRWAYGDERLTEAKFGMTPEDGYVRFSITDKNGKSAHTRAYFWDEIFAE